MAGRAAAWHVVPAEIEWRQTLAKVTFMRGDRLLNGIKPLTALNWINFGKQLEELLRRPKDFYIIHWHTIEIGALHSKFSIIKILKALIQNDCSIGTSLPNIML